MYNHHIGLGSIASGGGPHSILPLSMQQKQQETTYLSAVGENNVDLDAATLHSTTMAANINDINMQKSMISLDIRHEDGKSILEQ